MKFIPHLLSLILLTVNLSFSTTISDSSEIDGFASAYFGDFGKGFQVDREMKFPGLGDSITINTFMYGYNLKDASESLPYLHTSKKYQFSSSKNLYLGLNKALNGRTIGFLIKDVSLFSDKVYDDNFNETALTDAYSVDLTVWNRFYRGPFKGVSFNFKYYSCEESKYFDYRFKEEISDYEDSLVLFIPFKLKKNHRIKESSGNSFELNLVSHETRNGGYVIAGGSLKTKKSANLIVNNITEKWEDTYLVTDIQENGDTLVTIEKIKNVLATPLELNQDVHTQKGEANLGFLFPQLNNVFMALNCGVRYAHSKMRYKRFFTNGEWDNGALNGSVINTEEKKYSDSISVFLESYFNKRFKINSFKIDLGLNGILTVKGFDEGKNNIKNYFDKPLYYYKNKSEKDILLTAPVYLSYLGKKVFTYIGWYPQYYSSSEIGAENGYEKLVERDLKFSSLELGIVYKVNDKISFHLTPGIRSDLKFLKSRMEVKW